MELMKEILPGAYLLGLKKFEDVRGEFVKTYSATAMAATGIDFDFRDVREEFYSVSHRDVIRGMHFQTPPHDHVKVVYCAVGAVLDVLLDLRSGPGYGRTASVRLSGEAPGIVIVPKGIAHGFLSLEDNSLMFYKTTTEHAPKNDCGIRWDSFGFDWGVGVPIVSERDRAHPPLSDFKTLF